MSLMSLRKLAAEIENSPAGLLEAQAIVDRLKSWLRPRLPAAGLAAPQLGISKRVIIFSWDRSEANLVGALNPSYEPIGTEKSLIFEGCFSVPLSLAQIPRYKKIAARYLNEKGEEVRCTLEGFGARVFQHECDHLQGLIIVDRSDAEVKNFETLEAMRAFIDEVKKNDASDYQNPVFESLSA